MDAVSPNTNFGAQAALPLFTTTWTSNALTTATPTAFILVMASSLPRQPRRPAWNIGYFVLVQAPRHEGTAGVGELRSGRNVSWSAPQMRGMRPMAHGRVPPDT